MTNIRFVLSNISLYMYVVFLWDEKKREREREKKEQRIEDIYLAILPLEIVATHTFQRFSGLPFLLLRDVLLATLVFSFFPFPLFSDSIGKKSFLTFLNRRSSFFFPFFLLVLL